MYKFLTILFAPVKRRVNKTFHLFQVLVDLPGQGSIPGLAAKVSAPMEERSSSSSSGCSSLATVCEWTIDVENPASKTPDNKPPAPPDSDDDNNSGATATGLVCSNMNLSSGGIGAYMPPAVGTYVPPPWACPNVSLLPDPVQRPLTRVSSVGSGRNVCLDEAETSSGLESVACTDGTFASVLVVTHGGLIAEILSHFLNDLNCSLPGRQNAVDRTTPNAALSRFSVRLPCSEDFPEGQGEGDEWTPVHVSCLTLHDVDHILHDADVLPISTHDAY